MAVWFMGTVAFVNQDIILYQWRSIENSFHQLQPDRKEGVWIMIHIRPEAEEALAKYDRVLRLQVRTSGCCEPALAAFWDEKRPDDLSASVGALTLVVDRDSFGITGAITVDIDSQGDPPTLLLATDKPLSEWAGLCGTSIGTGPE